MLTGNQRGQIKCVTAGTQVRRRANTCTRLLPHSIVPSASVSSSAPLDSRGFLIGQADPADTRPLPLQWSTGTYHCLVGGTCQESWACPQQRTGSQPATRMGPGGLPCPTQAVSSTLPPLQYPQQVGSHQAAGSSLPPSRGLCHGHLVSRFRRAEASPINTSTRMS